MTTKKRHTGLRLLSVASMATMVVLAAPAVSGATARTSAARALTPQFGAPTKALCKQASYKIGYDVFSEAQPFANLVTQGLVDAAKSIGCVTIVKTTDNLNGPVAIGNLKTLIVEKIQGFVDFQVLAAYQPAITKILATAKIPGVAIVGANLPGSPDVGASNYTAAYDDGVYLAQQSKARFPGKIPYVLGGAEPPRARSSWSATTERWPARNPSSAACRAATSLRCRTTAPKRRRTTTRCRPSRPSRAAQWCC